MTHNSELSCLRAEIAEFRKEILVKDAKLSHQLDALRISHYSKMQAMNTRLLLLAKLANKLSDIPVVVPADECNTRQDD